ncbi:MAG TPA: hypothetical protein VLA54_07215 [Acidimicrobiia bacterium]|nr:hypothetical protein [Acidimicrobiia bacterium]
MQVGELGGQGWSSGPVVRAVTFYQRWQGLRRRLREHGLLIRGSSVHGFGMREPLLAIGLDRHRAVMRVGLLRPARIVWFRGAVEVLELAADAPMPPVGTVLTWRDASHRRRPPDPLRHPDREPG